MTERELAVTQGVFIGRTKTLYSLADRFCFQPTLTTYDMAVPEPGIRNQGKAWRRLWGPHRREGGRAGSRSDSWAQAGVGVWGECLGARARATLRVAATCSRTAGRKGWRQRVLGEAGCLTRRPGTQGPGVGPGKGGTRPDRALTSLSVQRAGGKMTLQIGSTVREERAGRSPGRGAEARALCRPHLCRRLQVVVAIVRQSLGQSQE